MPRVISILFLLLTFTIYAEVPPLLPINDPATAGMEANAAAADAAADVTEGVARPGVKSMNHVLLEKLKRPDGTELSISVLSTIDQNKMNLGEFFTNILMVNLQKYGHDDVRLNEIQPTAINLENFRNIVLQTKTDIVLASLLKPQACELFLFDKRSPYQIYYYSQEFPEEVQNHLTQEILEEFIKSGLRRLLYSYVQGNSYEMPREITTMKLHGEDIPFWIARRGLVSLVNKDALSRAYLGTTVGGSLALGLSANSSVVGIQFGYRVLNDWYIETSAETFNYNAISLSLKHTFSYPDNPMQVMVGLGTAFLFSDHAIGYDQAYLPRVNSLYIVPSFAVVFPIVEIYLKLASEFYFSPAHRGVLVTLGPGLFMRF